MIKVRAAAPGDAAVIADFQLKLARETESLELDAAVVARGVQAVFDSSARGAYWIAEKDGAVAGCLLTTPEWSDWRCATVLWIQSLYVVPEARGTGVFAALYAELKALVENDAAFAGIRLTVDQRNARACAVYERVGMRRDHYYLYEHLKAGAGA